MGASAPFDRDLLNFLSELSSHNDRDWFEANKPRYERVYKQAFAGFVDAFGPRLERISPHLVADPRPSGGSVMRIYRDTRFSKDKSPYRTYTVVHFGHRKGGEGRAPGLFLYVSPDEIAAGGGLWHPEPPVARRIRRAIADDPKGWRRVAAGPSFRRRFELTGESLRRVPTGFPKDHPQALDLMRKDFVASTTIPTGVFLSPRFLSTYEELSREVAPFLRYLCEAVGLPF